MGYHCCILTQDMHQKGVTNLYSHTLIDHSQMILADRGWTVICSGSLLSPVPVLTLHLGVDTSHVDTHILAEPVEDGDTLSLPAIEEDNRLF